MLKSQRPLCCSPVTRSLHLLHALICLVFPYYFLIFGFVQFYFICKCLCVSACTYICVPLTCLVSQRSEEGSKVPGNVVRGGCESPCRSLDCTRSSVGATRARNCWAVSSVPALNFFGAPVYKGIVRAFVSERFPRREAWSGDLGIGVIPDVKERKGWSPELSWRDMMECGLP